MVGFIYALKVVTMNAMNRYYRNSSDNLMRTDTLSPDVLYQDISETEDYKLLCDVADGFLQSDIAKANGLSLSACKKRIQRARERLKKKIILNPLGKTISKIMEHLMEILMLQ